MSTTTPFSVSIGHIEHGVAGQYAYQVQITFTDASHTISKFVGSEYGGPVFVNDIKVDSDVTARCGGRLDPEFIRRFYGVSSTPL